MTAPLVLAFDCSGPACAVALARRNGARQATVLAHHAQPMLRGHAAALAPMIEATLKAGGVRPADLRLIAVTVGPGSFTGVRIGLATARGFALALGVPVAGLTTIDVLLYGTTAADRQRIATERRRLLAAIDTHRGDYYTGFDDAPEPFIADVDRIAACASGGALLIAGDGAASLCAALKAAGIDAEPAAASATPDAAALAALALRHDVEHWRAHNDREGMPRPLYLRPADVTLPKAAG